MKIVASDWKPYVSGQLKGWLTLTINDQLKFIGCGWFSKGDKEWIGFPSKAYVDRDKNVKYSQCIELTEEAKKTWLPAMLAAAKAAYPNVSGAGQAEAARHQGGSTATQANGVQRYKAPEKAQAPQEPLDDEIPF